MERGAWSVERGAWSVERGAWSVERGAIPMRNAEFGLRSSVSYFGPSACRNQRRDAASTFRVFRVFRGERLFIVTVVIMV